MDRGGFLTVTTDEKPVVVAWMRESGLPLSRSLSMVMIDLKESAAEVIPLPGDGRSQSAPFFNLLSREGKLYSVFGDVFYEFDPSNRQWRTFAIGQYPAGQGGSYSGTARSMFEDEEGRIYAALQWDARLVRLDPETGELTDFGPLHTEEWDQAPGALAMDRTGWIYAGIGPVQSQIVAFHPESDERRVFLTEEDRERGRAPLWLGEDGAVYAQASPGAPTLRLLEGELTELPDNAAAVKEAPTRAMRWQHPDPGGLPDGRRLAEVNLPREFVVIENPATGQRERIEFELATQSGALAYSIARGPGETIVGSTGHPMRFWQFDPATDKLSSKGLADSRGHINALTLLDGKLAGGIYSSGVLFLFDPSKPWDEDWNTPESSDANPRQLAAASPEIMRPEALVAHPKEPVLVMTGSPVRGATGGGMLISNPETGENLLLSDQDLLPNHQTKALGFLDPETLVGGTSVRPASRGRIKAEEPLLYFFDWNEKKVVFQTSPVPEAQEIRDLSVASDGRIFGITATDGAGNGPSLFVFDPETRETVHVESMETYGAAAGTQAPRIMAWDEEGRLLLLFRRSIVRVDPSTLRHELLGRTPAEVRAGPVLLNGRLYFTDSNSLWSCPLP